jgi:hypothetical protein
MSSAKCKEIIRAKVPQIPSEISLKKENNLVFLTSELTPSLVDSNLRECLSCQHKRKLKSKQTEGRFSPPILGTVAYSTAKALLLFRC